MKFILLIRYRYNKLMSGEVILLHLEQIFIPHAIIRKNIKIKCMSVNLPATWYILLVLNKMEPDIKRWMEETFLPVPMHGRHLSSPRRVQTVIYGWPTGTIL